MERLTLNQKKDIRDRQTATDRDTKTSRPRLRKMQTTEIVCSDGRGGEHQLKGSQFKPRLCQVEVMIFKAKYVLYNSIQSFVIPK